MRFYPTYKQGWEDLESMIAEGEHGAQDFKQSVPAKEKIARTLAAFANAKGGRLLVGINDRGEIIGTDVEQEMYELHDAAELYCDPPVDLEFIVHEEDGLEVLEAKVLRSLRKPHAAQDEKGAWQLYVRNGDQTMLAGVSLEQDSSALALSSEDRDALLRHVRNHGSISLDEAAAILRTNRKKASEYLGILLQEGLLEEQLWRGKKCFILR
jgi:predicted HTH transcriptional regulator